MTEDNQNKDLHWVNHVKITNRVSGNHLPDDKPTLDSCNLTTVKSYHLYQTIFLRGEITLF